MTSVTQESKGKHFFRVALVLATMVAMTFVARTVVSAGPFLFYKLRSRSIPARCAAIHPGMNVGDVELLLRSGGSQLEESLNRTELSFGNWDLCQIKLDPDTHTVVSVHMANSAGHPTP